MSSNSISLLPVDDSSIGPSETSFIRTFGPSQAVVANPGNIGISAKVLLRKMKLPLIVGVLTFLIQIPGLRELVRSLLPFTKSDLGVSAILSALAFLIMIIYTHIMSS